MQNLQDSVFSIVKTTSLSSAVFNYLQPTEDHTDQTPLGGILSDTKHGWLALGPKFCVIDLRTGLKVAAWTFSATLSNSVTSVVELQTPLTENSKQLIISLECEGITGIVCVFHINGSQVLRCIQTEVVVTQLAICDQIPDGPLTCFDGVILAGTKTGEILAFDLNRAGLIQALKDISQGDEHLVRNEFNMANITLLPLHAISDITEQREIAIENDDHLGIVLNENSLVDGQYLFYNPDGTIRMKAKKNHIRVSTMQYIPQLGSLAIGYNFGAFQIWNLMSLELEFTSQVNVECLPVTNFGFQEPCDDPRAFCYLWVVYSVVDRFEEEEFPLAVMYSLTYQGKRMLSDTKYLYQDFSTCNMRFQVELSAVSGAGVDGGAGGAAGGRCVSCHAHTVVSTAGDDDEDSVLNLIQLVWEWWGVSHTQTQSQSSAQTQYGMLLFDLDQWYKAQMPSTYNLQSNAFMSATSCVALSRSHVLDVQVVKSSVAPYLHPTTLEEHLYPNSLQYNCISLCTSEASVLFTSGIQRQILSCVTSRDGMSLLEPSRLHAACLAAGLMPSPPPPPLPPPPVHNNSATDTRENQRRFLLSVCLSGRGGRFLKQCARTWAAGTHAAAGCTLPFLVDWCWKRAMELKESAKELTTPLFTSTGPPDRNALKCLNHCVRQLTELTSLLDCILTKCCNLVVPDALSSMEQQQRGVRCVCVYLQALQWCASVNLLPPTHCPLSDIADYYTNRRIKLSRLQDSSQSEEEAAGNSCSLLFIDQLVARECGGDMLRDVWRRHGSRTGLYPPPSLPALLRVYLLPLPPSADPYRHQLLLYLLLDYSDQMRDESVIRRLMQFPTMFGLSNTDIKTTQAFWYLDHRDFDYALEQLQCLPGSGLPAWQQQVVVSTLVAQHKPQAALHYLHARKPSATNANTDMSCDVSGWSARCALLVSRALVADALHAAPRRTAEEHAASLQLLFTACRNSGQLSKLLRLSLSAFEEEMFIRYLQQCDDHHAQDILVMYYLQQARYLEAQQYNNKLKQTRSNKAPELSTSVESLSSSSLDRRGARDILVDVVCATMPNIIGRVAQAVSTFEDHSHVVAPKPMSVFVQAKSPKNTFTYKSSFIQDTIENASETWMNKPSMRKGLKRALDIEDTPFLCTPKLNRTKSIFSRDESVSCTPSKRARLSPPQEAAGPVGGSRVAGGEALQAEVAALLDMPDIMTPPQWTQSTGRDTPHSILKVRRSVCRSEMESPMICADSDSDDSEHTHASDAKHLRFTIPTASESGSTPSPPLPQDILRITQADEKEMVIYTDTSTRSVRDHSHILESPTKSLGTEEKVAARKSFKDSVRSRQSLSMSINSSLSEDPNSSIESIADLDYTLINKRYHTHTKPVTHTDTSYSDLCGHAGSPDVTSRVEVTGEGVDLKVSGRKPLRSPERADSPVAASARTFNRSKSRTPELSPRSSSSLSAIPEQPIHEAMCQPQSVILTVPTLLKRSRSRTPERSPRLPAITESPPHPPSLQTESEQSEPAVSPSKQTRTLRSRSRTPEVETTPEKVTSQASPRSLRRHLKTPERDVAITPIEKPKTRKSLSRMVLEHNTFANTKHAEMDPNNTAESSLLKEQSEGVIECTPMKSNTTQLGSLLDVTFSPIVNKSVLQSSVDSSVSQSTDKPVATPDDKSKSDYHRTLPAFTTFNETFFEKSVLKSYQSSVAEDTASIREEIQVSKEIKFSNKTLEMSSVSSTSVLKDCSSLMTSDSDIEVRDESVNVQEQADLDQQKEKQKIVEIEREINEIEVDISEDESGSDQAGSGDETSESDDEEDGDDSSDKNNCDSCEEYIISINDSTGDDSSSSSSNKLQIDEKSNSASSHEGPVEAVVPTKELIEVQVKEQIAKEIEPDVQENRNEISMPTESSLTDPLNQAVSILTDDNSILESDSEDHLHYPDEPKEAVIENILDPIKVIVEDTTDQCKEAVIENILDTITEVGVEIANKCKKEVTENISDSIKEVVVETATPVSQVGIQIEVAVEVVPQEIVKENMIIPPENVDADVVDAVTSHKVKQVLTAPSDQIQHKPAEKLTEEPEKLTEEPEKQDSNVEQMQVTEEKVEKVITTRKRAMSNSSNKSDKTELSTPKSPSRIKRKSETENTGDTPSSRRTKTPTSTEVRRILTRRASKELSESKVMDDSQELNESLAATPKRRTSRIKSKDDNVSVASDTSVKSTRSKTSAISEELDRPIRKSRKSILMTKPDLSVIPEMSTDDGPSKLEDNSEIVSEYSSARRLTRHQKSLLESWLEQKPASTSKRGRRGASVDVDHDDSTTEQTYDRIQLLNKTDFQGSPDVDEYHFNDSPDSSIVSDGSRVRRARLTRAASESRSTPKAKPLRRGSVDIGNLSQMLSSPVGAGAAGDSPGRARRACFNKACEALATPRGRRTSTDVKRVDGESVCGSPAPSEPSHPSPPRSPARRTRRVASTQSNTSQSSRRSKKSALLDESKDAKL